MRLRHVPVAACLRDIRPLPGAAGHDRRRLAPEKRMGSGDVASSNMCQSTAAPPPQRANDRTPDPMDATARLVGCSPGIVRIARSSECENPVIWASAKTDLTVFWGKRGIRIQAFQGCL